MNATELAANEMADDWSLGDLNVDPTLAYEDASFDAVTCAVSVDYLSRPLDVFAEVARVLRAGGPFVCTFSNRCFPTKAIRGWLSTDDRGRCAIVAAYFAMSEAFDEPIVQHRNPGAAGDPLYAVRAPTTLIAPAASPARRATTSPPPTPPSRSRRYRILNPEPYREREPPPCPSPPAPIRFPAMPPPPTPSRR